METGGSRACLMCFNLLKHNCSIQFCLVKTLNLEVTGFFSFRVLTNFNKEKDQRINHEYLPKTKTNKTIGSVQ